MAICDVSVAGLLSLRRSLPQYARGKYSTNDRLKLNPDGYAISMQEFLVMVPVLQLLVRVSLHPVLRRFYHHNERADAFSPSSSRPLQGIRGPRAPCEQTSHPCLFGGRCGDRLSSLLGCTCSARAAECFRCIRQRCTIGCS